MLDHFYRYPTGGDPVSQYALGHSADTQDMLSVARGGCQPSQVVALGAPDAQPPAIPLLQDRGLVDGQATVYVCHAFVRQAPVAAPEGLRAQVES